MPFTERPTKMVYFDISDEGIPFIEITTMDNKKLKYIVNEKTEWEEITS